MASDNPSGQSTAVFAAFEQSDACIVACEGPDLRVAAMNARARGLTRSPRPAGRPLDDLLSGPMATWVARFRQVWSSGLPVAFEDLVTRSDPRTGHEHTARFDVLLQPWRHPGGDIRGVIGEAYDVTHLHVEDAATTMQDALLPSEVPVLPRTKVSATSLVADAAGGGDWFEAMPLPDRTLGLVVGDVPGQGMDASALMALARAVMTERLRSGLGLSTALRTLDALSESVPELVGATLLVAVLDPVTRRLSYCTAGHPPPLVLPTQGEPRYLAGSGAGPIGTGDSFAAAHEVLSEQDLVVCYTDGALTCGGQAAAESPIHLAATTVDSVRGGTTPGSAADRACVSGLERLCIEARDDITLLAVELCAPPPRLEIATVATPDAVQDVQTELGAWLLRSDPRPIDEMCLKHAVGEVVTNAVTHAYADPRAPGSVRVAAELTDWGDVVCTVADSGQWRAPAPEDGAGRRGLATTAGLVDHLHVDHGSHGTTVTLRHRLTRSATLFTPQPRLEAEPPVPTEPGLTVTDQPLRSGLAVSGPLDDLGATRLRSVLLDRTQGWLTSLTLDLAGVTQLSNTAVQVLLEALERTADHQERLLLVAPLGTPAQQVLDRAGLPRVRSDAGGSD